MKVIFVVAALLTVTSAFDYEEEWQGFKSQFGKKYSSDLEELTRHEIFESNMKYIEEHNKNADKHGFTLGVNEYADLSGGEFGKVFNGYLGHLKTPPTNVRVPKENALPDTVDWRTKGVVTPIKNQGLTCGSCWAFSATGSLEGQHALKTGKLVSLSEQQLVDCSGKFGNYGCAGGLMDNAFKYIKENGGDDTEASYPYVAHDERCHFKPADVGATCTGYVDVKHDSESALQEAVANVGPISVAIDARHASFQFYNKGVYNEKACSSTKLDHGVLAVGYGTYEGEEYWLVKNSWGTNWGMKGYIMMSRNKHNQCGIASNASYPLV